MQYKVHFFCNTNTDKFSGYKPAHLIMEADVATIEAADDHAAAEAAFYLWNMNRPAHYDGPSMSVGDVVMLRSTFPSGVRYMACASFGWEVITPPLEWIDSTRTLIEVLNQSWNGGK